MTIDQLRTLVRNYVVSLTGIGLIIEWSLKYGNVILSIKTPLRYFYWTFAVITFIHLLVLSKYIITRDESKKTGLALISLFNYFILSFLAIGIYYWGFYGGSNVEAVISLVAFCMHFVFSIALMLRVQ